MREFDSRRLHSTRTRPRSRVLVSTAVLAAGAALVAVQAAAAPALDSPRLVVNTSIGDVQLGMLRSRVESLYGSPARTEVWRRYFAIGTRYEGRPLVRTTYRLHGGSLVVEYVDGRVRTIRTTSRFYRTARGTGVGTRLPRDRCIRLDEIGHIGPRGCERRWRGFKFDGECGDAWLAGDRRRMTILFVHRGRQVRSVLVGDPDVILYCF